MSNADIHDDDDVGTLVVATDNKLRLNYSGFPEEKLFLEFKSLLHCSICSEPFTYPHEAPCCGMCFCYKCLKDRTEVERNTTCPLCKVNFQSLSTCRPNRLIQRMADALPGRCDNPGCRSVLTRGELRETHTPWCPWRPIPSCNLHNLPKLLIDLSSLDIVCPLCVVLSKDRHHRFVMDFSRRYSRHSATSRSTSTIASDSTTPSHENASSTSGTDTSNEEDPDSWSLSEALCLFASVCRDVAGIRANNKLTLFSGKTSDAIGADSDPDLETDTLDTEERKAALLFLLLLKTGKLLSEEMLKTLLTQVPSLIRSSAVVTLSPSVCSLIQVFCKNPLPFASLIAAMKETARYVEEELYSEVKIDVTKTPKSSTADSSSLLSVGEEEVSDPQLYDKLKKEYDEKHFNFTGMQVRAVPQCSYLYKGNKNKMFVLLDIRVGKKVSLDEEVRPPFALSVVLDNSGSMSGSLLDNAKKAASMVVDNIQEGDVVNFVTYSNTSVVIFEGGKESQKALLKEKISKVQVDGATNMHAGIQKGVECLQKQRDWALRRIFLFSDGMVNAGKNVAHSDMFNYVETEVVNELGICISSFGLGTNFDEVMMKGISKKGKGNYFFIDRPENIPDLVAKGFKGLSRTVASNLVLKIVPRNGFLVKRFVSATNEMEDPCSPEGAKLPDAREKDLKQVLLEIEVDENVIAEGDEFIAFDFELSYDKQDKAVAEGPIKGVLNLKGTNDSRKLFNKENLSDEVEVFATINECSALDREILKLLDERKVKQALEVKKAVVANLQRVLKKDTLGFVQVLLTKAKQRVSEMKIAAEASASTSSHSAAASLASLKKYVFEDVDCEECEDMGFGLFD